MNPSIGTDDEADFDGPAFGVGSEEWVWSGKRLGRSNIFATAPSVDMGNVGKVCRSTHGSLEWQQDMRRRMESGVRGAERERRRGQQR